MPGEAGPTVEKQCGDAFAAEDEVAEVGGVDLADAGGFEVEERAGGGGAEQGEQEESVGVGHGLSRLC